MRLNPKLLFKIGVPGFDDSGRGDRGCDGPPMDSRFGAYDQANGTVDHFRHDSDCDRNKPLNRVTTQVGFGGRDGPPHSLPLVHSHVNETFQNMLKGNAVVSRGWSGSLNTPRTLVGTGASRCERLDLKQVNSGHDIDHEGRVRAFVDPDDGDTREEILEGEDTDLHHHHVGIDRGNSENKSFNHQPLSKAKITRFDENYGGICVDYGHPLNSGSVDGICSIPNGQIDVSYQHETNVGFVRRNHTHCDNGGDCIDGVKADLNFNNCISNNESVERRVHDMGCERDYVGVGTQSFLHSKASKPLRVLHHNPKLKTALIIRVFVGAATLLGIMRCDATGRLLRNKDRGANGGGFFGERQHEPQTISLSKLFPIVSANTLTFHHYN